MQHYSQTGLRNLFGRRRLSLAAAASLLFLASFAAGQAQSIGAGRDEPRPLRLQDETGLPVYVARTDSPRATLSSFLHLRAQLEEAARAYWEKHDRSNAERAVLIDLSEVPAASRRAIGAETGGYLLDILGHIPVPNLDDVPDVADLGADGSAAYAIPDTPFHSGLTVVHAPASPSSARERSSQPRDSTKRSPIAPSKPPFRSGVGPPPSENSPGR